MIFTLMNKDTPICKLRFIGGKAVINKSMPSIFRQGYWLDKRFQSIIEQESLKKLLYSGTTSIDEFYTVTKALSLNDTFWLKPEGCTLNWEQINPYKNPICTDFANSVLQAMKNGVIHNVNRTISQPDFALTGQYDKKWKRINGSIYLIKAGTYDKYGQDLFGNEPFSEYYAYHISQLLSFGKQAVEYELTKQVFSEHEVVATRCKLFTTEKTGFMPNEFISKNGKTDLEFAIEHNQLARYLVMCLLDAIILNIDRHDGNFGYLVDNDKHTIVGMAPIFDNNLQMLCKDAIRQKTADELVDIITSKKPYKQMCPAGASFPIMGVWACRELIRNKAIDGARLMHILHSIYGSKLSLSELNTLKMGQRRTEIVESVVRFNAWFISMALKHQTPYNQIGTKYKEELKKFLLKNEENY